MNNKRGIVLVIASISIALILVNLICAAGLNIKVIGKVNDYSSMIRLKTDPQSTSGIDNYDMLVPPTLDSYAKLYSEVYANQLNVDSWEGGPRDVMLVYTVDPGQTGDITFIWDSIKTSDYDGTFVFYGDDYTYSDIIGSVDMRTHSSYSTTIDEKTTVYAKIDFTDREIVSPDESFDNMNKGAAGASSGDSSQSSSWTKTITKNFEFSSVDNSGYKEITETLDQKERIKFILDNEPHYVGIAAIKSGNIAIVTVMSDPVNLSLNVGEEKEIDVNDDNQNDISVKLESIVKGKAIIIVKNLNRLTEPLTPIEKNSGGNSNTVNEPETTDLGSEKAQSSTAYIIFFLIIAIVMIGLIVLITIFTLKIIKMKKAMSEQTSLNNTNSF